MLELLPGRSGEHKSSRCLVAEDTVFHLEPPRWAAHQHLSVYVSSELHSIPIFQKETESQRPSDLVDITQLVSAEAGMQYRVFELRVECLLSDYPWQPSLHEVQEGRRQESCSQEW